MLWGSHQFTFRVFDGQRTASLKRGIAACAQEHLALSAFGHAARSDEKEHQANLETFQPHNMGAITAVRQGQQNRRGRGRQNGNSSNGNSNNSNQNSGQRKHQQNPLSRSFESNGPDVKVRGTPAHIAEKYLALARDAQTSGDPVLAENYFQHAEHYNRIIMAYREQMQPQGDASNDAANRLPRDPNDPDAGFGDDESGAQDNSEASGNMAGQPSGYQPQGGYTNRPQNQQQPRHDRNDRQDRGPDRERNFDGPPRDDRQFRRDRDQNPGQNSGQNQNPNQNQNRFRNNPNGGQRNGGDRGYNNDRGTDRGYEPRSDQQREPRFDNRDAPRDQQRDGPRDSQRDGQRDNQRDAQREPRGGYRAERPDQRPDNRPEPRRDGPADDVRQSDMRSDGAELRQGLPTDRPPIVRAERAEHHQPAPDVVVASPIAGAIPAVAAAPKRRERATPAHDQPDFLLRPVRRPRAKPEAASVEAASTITSATDETPTKD
jgi:Domain of unknown function (DUF4167)